MYVQSGGVKLGLWALIDYGYHEDEIDDVIDGALERVLASEDYETLSKYKDDIVSLKFENEFFHSDLGKKLNALYENAIDERMEAEACDRFCAEEVKAYLRSGGNNFDAKKLLDLADEIYD